jgi:hypothetical protein
MITTNKLLFINQVSTFLFPIFLVLTEVSLHNSFKLWSVERERAKPEIVNEVAEVRLEQRIKTFNCEVPNLHLITNLH